MEIKGVNIQNEENYYKILSVLKNNEETTVKDIYALNLFLNGRTSVSECIKILSGTIAITDENKEFSAIRALIHRESYSFFKHMDTR